MQALSEKTSTVTSWPPVTVCSVSALIGNWKKFSRLSSAKWRKPQLVGERPLTCLDGKERRFELGATVSTGPAHSVGRYSFWTEPSACRETPRGVVLAGPGVKVQETYYASTSGPR